MRLYIFFFFLFLSSCSHQTQYEASDKNRIVELQAGDTILPKYPLPINPDCKAKARGYFTKLGLNISNFYEIEDLKNLDYDGDKKIDTLMILSPLSLIPGPEKGGKCMWITEDTIENRLLLITYKSIDKSKVMVFSELISNQATMAWSGYEVIEAYPNGFQLHGKKGQGHIFEYFIRTEQEKGRFFIQSIKIQCSNPFKEELIKYRPKEFPLENYQRIIIDSLRAVYFM
jgi:hypothetical protein